MRRACLLFALVLAATPLAGFISASAPDCCAGGGDMACCLVGADGGPSGCSLRRCSEGDSPSAVFGAAVRGSLPPPAVTETVLAPADPVCPPAERPTVIEVDAPPVPPPRV